ncbi:CHC2 zinc finger domain-containing protein [Brevibacillus centrosporus]|uniref:CHC2 zinc finger domain-containing protein n=1 Tax=Brevibacillus centrosporus TaxID=54910 RepID=UPI001143277F|nr:CHC2 zinc finger domain-containing protein [Brevibacillus centrosporus]MEC2133401.1 CHC2 zinc finger domain-containing protein [Brevibacillus centrosporus]GED34133.1 hypothetical protein BCE02nite_52740 [Brevibacillus centrosporus]
MQATKKRISDDTVNYAKYLPILDLIERILMVPRKTGSNIKIICPFHTESTPSFNINTRGNFFKCHGCGVGGMGSIDFMIQYQWGPHFKGDSTKYVPAIELICGIMNEPIVYDNGADAIQAQPSSRTPRTPQRPFVPKEPEKDISLIKKANQLLLKHTNLSPEHLEHLRSVRQLPTETILAKGYRSFPEKPSRVAAALAKELPTLEGIPGFYEATSKQKDQTYWTMKGSGGFLIPVRNEKMEITGFQHRVDKPRWKVTCVDEKNQEHKLLTAHLDYQTMVLTLNWDGKPFNKVTITEPTNIPVSSNGKQIGTVKVKPLNKYLWLASPDLPKGAGVKASYHIAVPTSFLKKKISPVGVKRVGITEGPLKGDIAAEILNIPFSCTPGLSNWRVAVEGALALNAEEYVIYLDSDALVQKKKNYNTGEDYEDIGMAIEGIARELVRAGKKVFLSAWDQKEGKGIDDLLLNHRKIQPRIFPIN